MVVWSSYSLENKIESFYVIWKIERVWLNFKSSQMAFNNFKNIYIEIKHVFKDFFFKVNFAGFLCFYWIFV